MNSKYIVIEPVRVRAAPSFKATWLNSPMFLPVGTSLEVMRTHVVGGSRWALVVAQTDGGARLADVWVCIDNGKETYLKPAEDMKPAAQAAQNAAVMSGQPWLLQHDSFLHGVHELCCGAAQQAASNGVNALMHYEDASGAVHASMEDDGRPQTRIHMHRKYFNQPIDPLELLRQHGVNPNETSRARVWLRGINEYDVPGFTGSPEDIKRRAEFDQACALALRTAAPEAVWVGGGFPHGCPDFTNPAVCDALKTYYAPLYNSGLMAFDMHNYSKSDVSGPKNYRSIAPIWLERRWEFLFTKCGFDPRIRRIVSSETGLEGPNGGFAHQGFTLDEFEAWMVYYSDVQRAPLVVDGVTYPSAFIASTHFQAGGSQQGRWMGYEMTGYLPVIYRRAKAVAGFGVAEDINVYAGDDIGTTYVPPAKNLGRV
jgi:hypothetical protein